MHLFLMGRGGATQKHNTLMSFVNHTNYASQLRSIWLRVPGIGQQVVWAHARKGFLSLPCHSCLQTSHACLCSQPLAQGLAELLLATPACRKLGTTIANIWPGISASYFALAPGAFLVGSSPIHVHGPTRQVLEHSYSFCRQPCTASRLLMLIGQPLPKFP